MPAQRWDWQPGLAASQPWRWWTAAFVHWSGLHLGANLLGLLLVALLGRAAGCGQRAAMAWFIAWPLTHVALMLQPSLHHYGGLSGVLHAGVAVAAWQLLRSKPLLRPLVGVALLAGLAIKVWFEAPWRGPLRTVPGWDILIAPAAHASGSLAGVLCAALLIRR
nr:rhombosortase [Aquabacterium terrae]